MNTFFIATLGCKVNQYESQALRETWLGKGWHEAAVPAEASLILVNSCAITAKAVADVRASVRKLHRSAPDAGIIITGCAAEIMREELAALPGVRAVVTQATKSLLLQVIPAFGNQRENIAPEEGLRGSLGEDLEEGLRGAQSSLFSGGQPGRQPHAQPGALALVVESSQVSPLSFSGTPSVASAAETPLVSSEVLFPPFSISGYTRARAVLKIQDGCSHFCSYCIVPYTRGKARSRPVEDALAEAGRLLEAGFREIVISGVNLRQYGHDWKKKPGAAQGSGAAQSTALGVAQDSGAGQGSGTVQGAVSGAAYGSGAAQEFGVAQDSGSGQGSGAVQGRGEAGPVSLEAADFWAFMTLLEERFASEWAGRARFRISSLEPGQLHEQALAVLGESRLIAPHVHLSLQSGSPSVLKRMGRGHYSLAFISDFFNSLQSRWPVFGLGADLISGFPGETEAEHAETMALCAALPLSYAHVFPYSSRPGTRAATMPEHLEAGVKKARSAELRALMAEKQGQFLVSLLAKDHVFVVPEHDSTKKDGLLHGVSEFYADCILMPEPALAKGKAGKSGGPVLDREALAGAGLVKARPVKVQRNRLVTSPLEVIT